MGQRRFQERFQAIGGANRLGFGVIEGPQIAKRLEKLRRQDQRQEPGGKGHRRAVMAEIQRAEVGEAEVDRHEGNRQ